MSGNKRRNKWLILTVATYSFIAFMINFSVFPVLSDDIAKEISLNYAQIGSLMSVFSIFYAVAQIPSGVLSDRFGGNKIASTSVLIIGMSGLLLVFASSYNLALIARTLLGLSGGLLLPSTMRLLPQWFDSKEYNRAMGIYGSAQGIAIFITFLFIPLVTSQYGWRTSLALVSALTLLAAVFSFSFLRDKGIVPNTLFSMSLKDFKEVITVELLLLTSFNTTALSMFTGILTWMPLFLLKKLNFTLIEVGYVTAVMGVMIIMSSYVGGVLASKIGGAKVILVSMILCFTAPLLLIFSSSAIEVFAINTLAGWAVMFYFGPTFSAIPNAVKNKNVGMGFGILNTLTFIGSSVMTAVTGFILESTSSFTLVFITLWSISLFGVIGSLIFIKHAPNEID
jgi:ACS family hexuronate transporter-like MFS transporter